MMPQTLKHGIGLFHDCQSAEKALIALKDRGFPGDKISVITKTPEDNTSGTFPDFSALPIPRNEGAKIGAVRGSTVGGLLALISGLSILLIPGYGPALAVESVLATFLGSGAVASATGLYGALRGWLIPDEQSRFYQDRVNQGDYLVMIEATKPEIQMAESILTHWGISNWWVFDAA